MKYIWITVLFASCTMGQSQQISKEAREDNEFNKLMEKFNQTSKLNSVAQFSVEKKTETVVTEVSHTIVDLKSDIVDLKTELDVTKERLETGFVIDTCNKYVLLPISGEDQDWK